MQSIYSQIYYQNSALHDYMYSFFNGYNFQDYAYSQTCIDNSTAFLNTMHQYYLNITSMKSWSDPYLLTVKVLGFQLNDFWFNCYNFGETMINVYETKISSFVDFGDVYLSFIFNLLANSISIKNASQNIYTATNTHNTNLMLTSVGQISRIVFDFKSY